MLYISIHIMYTEMLCDVIRCCKVLQASLAALVCICHIMSCYAQEHGGPKQAHRDRRT